MRPLCECVFTLAVVSMMVCIHGKLQREMENDNKY